MKFRFILLLFCVQFSFAQLADFKEINFNKADSIAKRHKKESLTNLPILSYNLTHNLTTDVEKFRAIFYWVCRNIKADYKQNEIVDLYREKFKNDSLAYLNWNKKYVKEVLHDLVKHKRTTCSGYAYLIKELCLFSDIECEIINGYGRTYLENVTALESVNHSWNAVKLNNKWYLCDATWASGYFLNTNYVKDFNEGYFLTKPLPFSKNHIPINRKWMLIENADEINATTTPLLYNESFSYGIELIQPNTFKIDAKQNEEVHFLFTSEEPLKKYQISLLQLVENIEFPYKIYDLQIENKTISFTCIFKEKGNFDIHLKTKQKIVATYVLTVK